MKKTLARLVALIMNTGFALAFIFAGISSFVHDTETVPVAFGIVVIILGIGILCLSVHAFRKWCPRPWFPAIDPRFLRYVTASFIAALLVFSILLLVGLDLYSMGQTKLRLARMGAYGLGDDPYICAQVRSHVLVGERLLVRGIVLIACAPLPLISFALFALYSARYRMKQDEPSNQSLQGTR